MDLWQGRYSGWRSIVVGSGLLGLLLYCHARQAQAQTPKTEARNKVAACTVRNIRSHSFLVHTDLSDREANELVERLEGMIHEISTYWGRPIQGTIECYVIRDFDNFAETATDPKGIAGIKKAEGVTLFTTCASGKSFLNKATVYSSGRPEVVLHEAVHAYCHQTFGRTGPVWYAEGMAEMGHYWKSGDSAVRIGPRELHFLRENLPRSLAETLSASQVSGDSWQNYVSRWALCHFLVHDPNYSAKFLSMGRGFLSGKDVSFDQTYGVTSQELSFEYLFFLQHIGQGYRVDLSAWDWNKKFACAQPGRMVAVTIRAGHGWQPTGLTVVPGTQYEYVAAGNWRVANQTNPVDADGDDRGRGKLVGVLMKAYELGAEFDMGTRGSLQPGAAGNLYLRCRNSWNELVDDSGRVTVKLKIQGAGAVGNSVAVPLATAVHAETTKVD